MEIKDTTTNLCFTLRTHTVYILIHESPSGIVIMSRLMKRRRSLLGRVIILTTLALVFSSGLTINRPQAQQAPNQQRPRRVNGTDQPPPEWKLKKPDTPAAGDEVEEGDVVRVETQLVSVPAVVTDGSGRPISGLKPENFRLIEDGQVQTISNFGTAETPFEIALLLDTSGSTRDDVALIRSAANSFIQALRPGDRVGVVAFNMAQTVAEPVATVEVVTPLTSNRDALRTAIENVGASNGTPYYDALERVADSIFRDPARDEVRGRRAIVALTDGVDSASNSDFATAKLKLSRAGIACYFIQVNTEDFVEDRLMKDCQDDGQLTLSQRQIERYRRIFFPSARQKTLTASAKWDRLKGCRSAAVCITLRGAR